MSKYLTCDGSSSSFNSQQVTKVIPSLNQNSLSFKTIHHYASCKIASNEVLCLIAVKLVS